MKAVVVYRSDPERNLKDPLPEKNGIVFRLIRGDLYDPLGDPNDWFTRPWPKRALRHRFTWLAFPFIAWRFGAWKGYAGAKVYGFDSPAYLNYPRVQPGDVHAESTAFCFSLRLRANDHK